MSSSTDNQMQASTDTLPAAVTTALEELKARLRKPETVGIAVKQYVVSELVKTLLALEISDLAISAVSSPTTDTTNDDGTATACHHETYTVLGHVIWDHEVCDTVHTTGTGSASTTITH